MAGHRSETSGQWQRAVRKEIPTSQRLQLLCPMGEKPRSVLALQHEGFGVDVKICLRVPVKP